MSSMINRRSLLSVGALSLAGILTGCGSESAPPSVDSGPKLAQPAPALDEERFHSILEELHTSLVEADKARDPRKLAPRVSGSAAEFRKATYSLISKVKEHSSALQRPSASLVVPISSTTETFPRHAIALVDDEAEGGLPFFVGLTQKDARSQYTSWGWARQAAGVQMPSVPGSETGAAEVAIDAKDLVLSPKDALKRYADILSHGHAKMDKDDRILEDPFQKSVHKEIQTEREQINKGVKADSVGTVHEGYAVKDGEYLGLRTADGGAMIMGTLTSTRKLTVKSGSIAYEEENLFTKIAGTKEFTKEIVRTYGSTVLLYVPTKDSGQKIQPIGAYKVLLSVSGK